MFPFDLAWDNLILGAGSRIVSFVLNVTHNSVMTPDLLGTCKSQSANSAKCAVKATKPTSTTSWLSATLL